MSDAADAGAARRRELLAILSHELRSPIGIILGFEELLSMGISGEVDERAREALARMRSSAQQLLQLVDGLSDLGGDGTEDAPAIAPTDPRELVTTAVDSQRLDAEGRFTTLELDLPPRLASVRTDAERAGRALQLALGAAIKTTHHGALRLAVRADGAGVTIDIIGAALSAANDEPAGASKLTGAGLRIAMARRALRSIGGDVELLPDGKGVTLCVRVPSLPA
jgi:signal transduction histidine kinase